jgi:chromosome segregation ATPase
MSHGVVFSLRQELDALAQQTSSQQATLAAAFEAELAGVRRDVAQARAEVDVQVQVAQEAQLELSAATEAMLDLEATVAELANDKVGHACSVASWLS